MFKNYLLTAIRNIYKQKAYSLINLLGLTIGITSAIIIVLYIQYELSYDTFHPDADRIYRVVEVIDPSEESSSLPHPARHMIENEFPHFIEATAGLFDFQLQTHTLQYKDEATGKQFLYNEPQLFFADSNIFDVFSIGVITGDPEKSLYAPNSIAITESAVERYFGDQNPIGKEMILMGGVPVTITAVLEDCPQNSHFHYEFLVSMSTLRTAFGFGNNQNWYWNPVWSYIKLKEGVSPEQLEEQFPAFVKKYFHPSIIDKTSLYLQSLTDIHLHSHIDFEIEANSDISLIYIFGVIALFIIVIASINFINLATARSMNRAREVGVRKVMGAYKLHLILQFLSESVILTIVALLLAAPLLSLVTPLLNNFAGIDLTFNPFDNVILIVSMLAVIVFVGILAGLYPAVYLSSFQPVKVLKGSVNKGETGAAFRKALVVFQFAISIILIIGTLLAFEQLDFMRNTYLGFNKDHVVAIYSANNPIVRQYDEFKDRLMQNSNIQSVSGADFIPGSATQTSSYLFEDQPEEILLPSYFVRKDFEKTLQLEFLAGRPFSDEFPTDDSLAVVVNETFIKEYNYGTPEEALGKIVNRTAPFAYQQRIVGVVKDFHFVPLRQPINPLIIGIPPFPGMKIFFTNFIFARISPDNMRETIAFIEDVHKEMVPDRPFDYRFVDAELDKQYKSEDTLGKVAGIFSGMAIFVACLGVIGLTSFTTQQRTKEIGIRKTLGASGVNIVGLLSKEFMLLIVVANAVAWPIAYYLVNNWLEGFAKRIDVGLVAFIIAAFAAFGIAFMSMLYQTLKAAMMNPVNSIKHE